VIETLALSNRPNGVEIPAPPPTLRLVTEREALSETLWFKQIKTLNKMRDNNPDYGFNLRQKRLD
jgi:hypothetical protein